MERARVLMRGEIPSIVSHSLRPESLNYVHKQSHNHRCCTQVNYGLYQGNHPLSRRLNAFLNPCPISTSAHIILSKQPTLETVYNIPQQSSRSVGIKFQVEGELR